MERPLNFNYGQPATVNLQGLNISNGCILSIRTLPEHCELYTNENKIQTTPYNITVQNNNLNLSVKPYDLSYVYENNISNLSTSFKVQVDCPTQDNIYEYSINMTFTRPGISVNSSINVEYDTKYPLSWLNQQAPYKIITLPKRGKLFQSNSELSLNSLVTDVFNFSYVANKCDSNGYKTDEFIVRYDNNSGDVKLMKFNVSFGIKQLPTEIIEMDVYYGFENVIGISPELIDNTRSYKYYLQNLNLNNSGNLRIYSGGIPTIDLVNFTELTYEQIAIEGNELTTDMIMFNLYETASVTTANFDIAAVNNCEYKIYTLKLNFRTSQNFTISPTNEFTLPLISDGVYNFVVHWGDGKSNLITSSSQQEIKHTYTNPNNSYEIKIVGQCEGWRFANSGDRLKLLDIKKWGDYFRLGTNQGGYFDGCSNLNISANNAPNLTGTINLEKCFKGCTNLDSNNLSLWDTINVTNMSGLFDGCINFDSDISEWKTNNVQDMSYMFNSCSKFNSSLNNWNTSKVFNMSNMFNSCIAFKQDISSWNIKSCVNFENMFLNANINNGIEGTEILDDLIDLGILNYYYQDTENYDKLLNSWLNQNPQKLSTQIKFHGGNAKYSSDALISRTRLMSNIITSDESTTGYNWLITDAGLQEDFVFTINTENLSDLSTMYNQFKLPLITGLSYNCKIYWGDGSTQKLNTNNLLSNNQITKSYSEVKSYKIRIQGSVSGWRFNNTGDRLKILDISEWGNGFILGTTQGNYFYGCSNLNISATKAPNLNATTNLSACFRDCINLNSSSLSIWNVINVTNMSNMFNNATSFKQDISNWNIINCVNFENMFLNTNINDIIDSTTGIQDTERYDRLLNGWLSKNPRKLSTKILFHAGNAKYSSESSASRKSLTDPISSNGYNWNITDGDYQEDFVFTVFPTISGTTGNSFTLPLIPDLSYNYKIYWGDGSTQKFNTNNLLSNDQITKTYSQVKSYKIRIQGIISGWKFNNQGEDRLKILDIYEWGNGFKLGTTQGNYFDGCSNLNISATNAINLTGTTNLSGCFKSCNSLNSNNLSTWNTGNVTDMSYMFQGAISFNGNINTWNVSNVKDMSGMFISTWLFNSELNNWDTSNVENMSYMFSGAEVFDRDINTNLSTGKWNVSKVKNMSYMFNYAARFKSSLSNWNVSSVINMSGMFSNTSQFNSSLSNWDVRAVTNMDNMFSQASAFKQDISSWNPISCNDFSNMFLGANINVNYVNTQFQNTENYDRLLNTWSTKLLQKGIISKINFHGGNAQYSYVAENARNKLLAPISSNGNNWDITDGGIQEQFGFSINTALNTVTPNQFKLPLTTGTYNFLVLWGDNTFTYITNALLNSNPNLSTRSYSVANTYNLKIIGQWEGWRTSTASANDRIQITDVYRWGNSFRFGNTGGYFEGCVNLNISANNSPNLTGTTNLSSCFNGCSKLNSLNLSSWNVSAVTNMSNMFSGCTILNTNIGSWDVTNVTNMEGMFNACSAFKQDISNWNIINCVNFTNMFLNANINDIISGNIQDTERYDKLLNGWLSKNPKKLSTKILFHAGNAKYSSAGKTARDRLILTTITTNPSTTGYNWNITDGGYQEDFVFTVNTANTSSSTKNTFALPLISGLTYNYKVYWGDNTTERLTATKTKTYNPTGIYTIRIQGIISGWQFNNNTERLKITDISEWGVGFRLGTTQGNYFYGCSNLNISATNAINLTGTTNLSGCFRDCISLTSNNLSLWNVSAVTNMSRMFQSATSFNTDISGWNTGNVSDMSFMFASANVFNRNINTNGTAWNVSKVTNMSNMFENCVSFNNGQLSAVNTSSLNNWNTSLVTNMSNMFSGCTSFNTIIDNWNVSRVTNFSAMFKNATQFNGSVNTNSTTGRWVINTTNNVSMTEMFSGTNRFNSELNNWNVSRVTNMSLMFNNCSIFNRPLNNWNVGLVSNMASMFSGCFDFKQDISSWDVKSCVNFTNMFLNTNINDIIDVGNNIQDTERYDRLLIGWLGKNPQKLTTQIQLHGGNAKYSSAGKTARDRLISTTITTNPLTTGYNWNITDGGLQEDFVFNINTANTSDIFDSTLNNQFKLPLIPDLNYNYKVYWGDNTTQRSTSSTQLVKTYTNPSSITCTITGSIDLYSGTYNINTTGVKIYTSKGVLISTTNIGIITGSDVISFNSTSTTNNIAINNIDFPLSVRAYSSDGSEFKLNTITVGLIYPLNSVNKTQNTLITVNSYIFNPEVNLSTVPIPTDFIIPTMYTIRIQGILNGWSFNQIGDCRKMTNISEWGVGFRLGTIQGGYFAGCSNLNITATNTLNLNGTTNLGTCFRYCSSMNSSNISNWNTNSVTDMAYMFDGCTVFNQPLTTNGNIWNVSNVRGMAYMFNNCSAFNAGENSLSLNSWNTGNVNNMSNMFNGCSRFNQPLTNWNTTKVTSMFNMFSGCALFNQPLTTNGNSWNVSIVRFMNSMFKNCIAFNRSLSSWNVTKVEQMPNMFEGATAFKQDISAWSPIVCTTFENMFLNANINTSITIDSTSQIQDTTNYDNLLISWAGKAVRSGTSTNRIKFHSGNAKYSTLPTVLSAITTLTNKFWDITHSVQYDTVFKVNTGKTPTLGGITGTNSRQFVLPLTRDNSNDYDFTVYWGDNTSEKISPTELNATTNAINAYQENLITHTYPSIGEYTIRIKGKCVGFNFNTNRNFNKDSHKIIDIMAFGEGLRLGADVGGYFMRCENLQISAINPLNLNGITNLSNCFNLCISLTNSPSLNTWDVSNITNMSNMFDNAYDFNSPLSNWDTSKVINMYRMFYNCELFDQPINAVSGKWNVGAVTNMSEMFRNCFTFNQELNNWNTGNVTRMDGMFWDCHNFDRSLSLWNVSKATTMADMFNEARKFKRDISSWNPIECKSFENFSISNFIGVLDGINTWSGGKENSTNYDNLLTSWSNKNVKTGVTLRINSKYSDGGLTGRNKLTASVSSGGKGWTIFDSGKCTSGVCNL